MSDPARLLVVHALWLRGVIEADDVAEYSGLDRATVDRVTAALVEDGSAFHRPGRISGFSLTEAGRDEAKRLLAADLDPAARARVERLYEAFLPVNARLLAVCTRWQLRGEGALAVVNDHSDPAHDAAVVAELGEVHEQARPLLEQLAEVRDRFGRHGNRLQNALDRVRAGDHDYLTKPMFPSYHSGWFELHEDLLASLGRERASEGSP